MGDIKRSASFIILLYLFGIINSYGQDCNIVSKANDIHPDKLCSPVKVDWDVTYRGVNDGGTGNVSIYIDWNDGSDTTIKATEIIPGEWTATGTHTYTTDDMCNYRPDAYLVVAGQMCTSSIQSQNVTVWDNDDRNGGRMAIDPDVFPICFGDDGSVTFMDVSQWNCEPPDENDVPNSRKRWIQWIYGTNSGNANFIDKAEVDGSVRAYPYIGAINVTTEPILGPQAPYNKALPIYIPAGYNVGDEFEVTLRNWNFCNPYDDPTIPGPPTDPINGDFDPVETTAIAVIVALPDGTITAVVPMCENEPPINLTAATGGGTWSGPGITNSSAGTFNPAVAGPGTHKIFYNVTNSAGCTATDSTEITVWDTPEADINTDSVVYLCPGVNLALDGNPSDGTTPYTHLWTGDTSPLDNTHIQTPNFNITTTGVYDLIYEVTDANACKDRDTVEIHVYPVDIHFDNKDVFLCTNITDTLKPEPSGGSGVYSTHLWSGTRTDLLSATDIEKPVFLSPNQGLFKYKYSVTDDQGCSASDSLFVHVFDQPVTNAGVNDTVCGLTNTLDAIPSAGTGTWSVLTSDGSISFTDSHAPNSDVTVDTYGTYVLEWSEDNNSCTDADTVTLVFYKTPSPVAANNGDTCGLSYTISVTPDYGTGYWSMKRGPGTPAFDDISDTTTNVSVSISGDYVFEWIESNSFGCTGSDSIKVGFHTIPVADIAPFDSSGCSPVIVDFKNASTDADTYYWEFGDGSSSSQKDPSHTYKNNMPAPDTATIKMVALTTFGCKDTTYKTMVINPSPISEFKADKGPGCSPLTVSFTNTSAGADTYLWSIGDGSPDLTDENITHTFINNETYVQSYPVTLVVENSHSCSDTSNSYITVYPMIHYDLTATPDTGCSPLKADLLADPGAFTYDWVFGDGQTASGSNAISHVYNNFGGSPVTYTATLLTSSTFGCRDTSNVDIVVFPVPESKFSFTPDKGCAPLLVAFNNESINADSATWKFGDGNILSLPADSNITHLYENDEYSPNTLKTVLVVQNQYGCTDSTNNYLTVNPKVTAIIDTVDASCSPYSVTIRNHSTGANEFFWNFGDGNTSTGAIGKNIYTNTSDTSAIYQISMIASSVYGCSDTAYTSAEVYPQPSSSFTLSANEGCAPLEVDLNNQAGNVSYSIWRFGDGNEETFPGDSSVSHTYINDGYAPVPYKVTLATENSFGCKDSSFSTITVYPQVKADISVGDNGCSPHEVALANSSTNAHKFYWDFGDGNTSTDYSGYNVFVNNTTEDTTFYVTLTATSSYGCSDSDTTTVTVYRVPKPDFTVVPEEQHLPNSTVTVTNLTAGENWDYNWLWGDGNSSTDKDPAPYTYDTHGVFNIRLIVDGEHCSDSVTRSVTIYSSMPEINYGPDTAGCPPLTVQFYNRSINADYYSWEFGDGGVSSEKEPEYTYRYPGEYKVKLTAYSPAGVVEKEDVTITVYETPTAYFEVVPSLVKIPGQEVSFLNRSTDAVSCLWDLGDGHTSTEFSFMYEYQEEGVYDVSLEVKNEKGCVDDYVIREAVTAEKGGDIKFPNAFTPNTSGPNGGHYVLGDKNNYVFYPFVQEGIVEYKLQIYTRWGELIFESNDIKVGWDGYYRGKLSPQGVYIYKATCKFGTGVMKIYTGDVTLLR